MSADFIQFSYSLSLLYIKAFSIDSEISGTAFNLSGHITGSDAGIDCAQAQLWFLDHHACTMELFLLRSAQFKIRIRRY